MRTFAAYLPKGNYNFGLGVFLRDEGTPHFATSEMAKNTLKNEQSEYSPNFLEYKKSQVLLYQVLAIFVCRDTRARTGDLCNVTAAL